ncbi:MAG TPA: sulfur transferase domain-containing protein [Hyphomonadaceae bacterium]|jgi:uncharacterized protein (TIGR01244 family)
MRFVLIAAALVFAAPAVADEPIKFPEKVQRTDFQFVIADAGPLYIAGQPSEAALRDMVAKGIKTIVNLRTQREMDNRQQVPYDEAALAKELGVSYVHIPLGGPDTPYTPEAVEKFAKAFESANSKVLLHCTVAWRASHMWAAYLVKYKGFTVEEAKRHGTAINLGGYAAGGSPIDSLLGTLKPN